MKRGSWALWHKEIIRDKTGTSYLTRLRIVQTPLFSIYRHHIHREDWDRALHDHPFPFVSLITRGGYIEQVAMLPTAGEKFEDRRHTVSRPRWSLNKMTRKKCHRIALVAPDTRTLVFVGPRRCGEDSWGFWETGMTQHTPWRQYLIEQGHPQAGDR